MAAQALRGYAVDTQRHAVDTQRPAVLLIFLLHISIKGAMKLCRAPNSGIIRVPAGNNRAYGCEEWDLIVGQQRFVSVALASPEKLMLLRRPDVVNDCN